MSNAWDAAMNPPKYHEPPFHDEPVPWCRECRFLHPAKAHSKSSFTPTVSIGVTEFDAIRADLELAEHAIKRVQEAMKGRVR